MTEARTPGAAGRTAKAEPVLKVMIIDPNPNHRDRLKSMVRQVPGVESVSDRGSPRSILDVLAQNPAHVIMIDQNPGAGDVFAIVPAIRAKPVGKQVQFVLLGDRIEDEARAKAAELGIRAFLQRPYDLATVEKVFSTLLPAVARQDESHHRAREGLRDMLDKLRQVSIFAGFADAELVRLLKICRTRQFSAGTYIFREGDTGTSLFVLVAGRLEIRTQVDGEDRVLVEMHPGDCFGEIAIIDAAPRSADALAATDCTVIEVNESVVNNNEDIISLKLVRQIAILLARKLRQQSHPPPR
jgi:CheY-like chemotaxis protein